MHTLWRISRHIDLDGNGGRLFSSRWNTIGRRIVYLAESPAGAMLEILVHLPFRKGKLPDEYNLMLVEVPDDCGLQPLEPRGDSWKTNEEITRALGDDWLAARETPLARVPSAIMPRTWNILLNPEHADATRCEITEVIRERFDNRLFRFGGR